MTLVCPECGSDQIGTLEAATIWQGATFTIAPEGSVGSFKDQEGREVDADWEMYDSEDVGDTDTVGFFCRGCITTWDTGVVPFVPEGSIGEHLAESRAMEQWKEDKQ